jgi:glutamate-1-semialdehyde aminotransferase
MEPAARMFISSTYWSDTLGLRAALTTLREVRRRDVPGHVQRVGTELQQKLNQVAAETGLAIKCGGLSIHPMLKFGTDDPTLTAKLATLYIQEMAKRGCHGYASFYLNGAQGPAEIEQTMNAAREVFALIAESWKAGTIDSLLECDPRKDPFRRLMR